jgi:hypothetical protein
MLLLAGSLPIIGVETRRKGAYCMPNGYPSINMTSVERQCFVFLCTFFHSPGSTGDLQFKSDVIGWGRSTRWEYRDRHSGPLEDRVSHRSIIRCTQHSQWPYNRHEIWGTLWTTTTF